MNLNVAVSGMPSYTDVEDIVEALVNTEGRKYPIPGYDHDDTAQEIRLECFRVLQFYDPKRIGPSPYKYLQTCIRNFLYNQRRGILIPNNPPCVRCPLWDRLNKTCTIDEVDCDKIVQYREHMATKATLKRPPTLESDVCDYNLESSFDAVLLDNSIIDSLSPNLICFYKKLKLGEPVPSRIKKQIRVIVVDIINNA